MPAYVPATGHGGRDGADPDSADVTGAVLGAKLVTGTGTCRRTTLPSCCSRRRRARLGHPARPPITEMRTAAVSAVATDLLALSDAAVSRCSDRACRRAATSTRCASCAPFTTSASGAPAAPPVRPRVRCARRPRYRVGARGRRGRRCGRHGHHLHHARAARSLTGSRRVPTSTRSARAVTRMARARRRRCCAVPACTSIRAPPRSPSSVTSSLPVPCGSVVAARPARRVAAAPGLGRPTRSRCSSRWARRSRCCRCRSGLPQGAARRPASTGHRPGLTGVPA